MVSNKFVALEDLDADADINNEGKLLEIIQNINLRESRWVTNEEP
jgi:hypothetical protein